MGDYTVPAEIRAMKPKGTIVKKIKGQYYVYSHSQSKDPQTGKWKTDSGKLLGKIIPGVGYAPNDKTCEIQGITCYDYGQYLLAAKLGLDDFNMLKECFNPDEAMQLFALAVIFCAEGYVGLKAAESYYERCLIARDYPALKFSYRRISKLLELIGRIGKKEEFQRKCLEKSSDVMAIDGHVIPTTSENNDLSSTGFKTRQIGSEYMNLMMAMDAKSHLPVGVHVFPGYMVDKKDFIDFATGIGSLKGKIILLDMGFFSAENMNFITSQEGNYVIPVSENRAYYKEITSPRKGRIAQFLYHRNSKVDTVEYREMKKDNRKIVYYRNISEAEKLSSAYLLNLEQGKPGFSMEDYDKKKKDFGIIVLETNLDDDAKTVYELYKSRWTIETFYDRLKNGIHFEELNLDDYATAQGVAFVMLISGRIDAKILDAAKKLKMTRKELMQLLAFLKLTDNGKSCSVHNIKKQHKDVLNKLEISLDTSQKCLG